MEESVVFLLGNGFNYMLTDFLKKYYKEDGIDLWFNCGGKEQADEFIEDLENITKLWGEIDDLFSDLIDDYDYTPEEIIKMVHSVLEFLNNIKNINKLFSDPKMIDNVKNELEKSILNRILEVSNKFTEFEKNEGYSKVSKIFPDFGSDFKKIFDENEIEKSYFVTTNYDGFMDSLLCSAGDFWLKDGFLPSQGKLKFNEDIFKNSHLRAHIHGSYRFYDNSFFVEKIRKNKKNENPVMIYNQPELKQKQIDKYDILIKYIETFKKRLSNSNKFFIIGNSLTCEPHIKKIIYNNFNDKSKTIYIYDKNPELVKNNLNKKSLKSDINLIDTRDFSNFDDFLNEIGNNLK